MLQNCRPIYQFSTYSGSTAENLGINNKSVGTSNDETNAIIKKLENRPSIWKTKENSKKLFSFFLIKNKTDLKGMIDPLDCSKAHQEMIFLLTL